MEETDVEAQPGEEAVRFEIERLDDYAKYLLHAKAEVAAVLRSLIQKRSLISAYFNNGRFFMLTSLLKVDLEAGEVVFECGREERINRLALLAEQVLMTTTVDQIKVQFVLGKLAETRKPAWIAEVMQGVEDAVRRVPQEQRDDDEDRQPPRAGPASGRRPASSHSSWCPAATGQAERDGDSGDEHQHRSDSAESMPPAPNRPRRSARWNVYGSLSSRQSSRHEVGPDWLASGGRQPLPVIVPAGHAAADHHRRHGARHDLEPGVGVIGNPEQQRRRGKEPA
jgi:hypothetical protein